MKTNVIIFLTYTRVRSISVSPKERKPKKKLVLNAQHGWFCLLLSLEDKAMIDNTKVVVLYMVEGAIMLPAIVTRSLSY